MEGNSREYLTTALWWSLLAVVLLHSRQIVLAEKLILRISVVRLDPLLRGVGSSVFPTSPQVFPATSLGNSAIKPVNPASERILSSVETFLRIYEQRYS